MPINSLDESSLHDMIIQIVEELQSRGFQEGGEGMPSTPDTGSVGVVDRNMGTPFNSDNEGR